ncbi:hypothetical protein ABWK29_14805 [Priestia megaterium]|uniref:hypothetical protein n=1 Tax=Priestia megaterium TaxID=1404 RepID=UPI0033914BB5
MDASIVNNIITSGVTVGVGILTAVVAYIGTIKGSKLQIEAQQETMKTQLQEERMKLEEERVRQAEFTKKAIERFLSYEIKNNFKLLNEGRYLNQFVYTQTVPTGYFNDNKYSYEEYNKLKYDLIKFESSEVQEILDVYNMFYTIERKQTIGNFTENEYADFLHGLQICLAKYDS